ncbi:MAG: VWA domain-containing protein [Spirochaetaceae bacterium]|jgi:hypothetical protein|nr:VWA domain-containing protein [Spirochaetaceae bacterium]
MGLFKGNPRKLLAVIAAAGMLGSLSAQERILRAGFAEKETPLPETPPLNIVLAVDTSGSMGRDNKLTWVKEAVAGFGAKLRPADSLELISFNTAAEVRFAMTGLDGPEKRRRFLDALSGLTPSGGTRLDAAFSAGYAEAAAHYQEDRLNLVILFTDEADFSSFEFNFSGAPRYQLLEIWNTAAVSMAALRVTGEFFPFPLPVWEDSPTVFIHAPVLPSAPFSLAAGLDNPFRLYAPPELAAGFSEMTFHPDAEEVRSRMTSQANPEISRISKGTGGISRMIR